MLFFLLPLLFNPFSFIIKWIPGLYLAAWPIIIQTMGRETLITHALVLIMFILVCDISRDTMLKLVGFDLMSLPLGIGLLIALTTDKGATFLSFIRPLFSGTLSVVEPIFLTFELLIFLDMIKCFNKWLASKANVRDEEAHDLSTWDPPLARSSLFIRVFIVVLTILSYLGVYIIIQESKSLLGANEDLPVNFHHAIAALVTLQLIVVSATIYKEEGVLSEAAMVALLASIPIFIAAWSYSNLKAAESLGSSWSSYFPFSLFSGSGASSSAPIGIPSPNSNEQNGDPFQTGSGGFRRDAGHWSSQQPSSWSRGGNLRLDLSSLEAAINSIESLDFVSRQLLLSAARRLIMVINSVLGLSLDQLAKYYFGPDFWYILAGRFLCIVWWTLGRRNWQVNHHSEDHYFAQRISSTNNFAQTGSGALLELRRLGARSPISARTLLKVALVLAYAQMIVQQMDNKEHLSEQVDLFRMDGGQSATSGGCCADRQPLGQEESAEDLSGWFNCMWSSAKACSSFATGKRPAAETRAARYYALATGSLAQVGQFVQRLTLSLWRLVDPVYLYSVWPARWRSIIVQRLAQSIVIQFYHINYLAFACH